MNKKKQAFTLIELLVVIVVIGILASMLMVGVSAARRQARTTQCKNNLKQLGFALNIYLQQESDGSLPKTAGTSASGSKDWCDVLRKPLGMGDWNDTIKLRDEFGGSNWNKYRVFDCPENNKPRGGLAFRFDYAYNTQLANNAGRGTWNISQCADVVALHDQQDGAPATPNVHACLGIHGGMDNFLFVDGRVETSDIYGTVDTAFPWNPDPNTQTP